MKLLIFFAFTFATVLAKDLNSRSIKVPVLENGGRIANGHTAEPGQFKYNVGLSFKIGNGSLWCSGSLIRKEWILTAAHCTNTASKVKIYLGANKRKLADKVHNVMSNNFITHSGWSAAGLNNDISLIRIPETNESSLIGIVEIPSNNDNKYLGDRVVVAGWGRTSDYETKNSEYLQFGILEVSPGISCIARYGTFFNEDVKICVDTPNEVSPCLGDSGGPLVLEEHNIQIGVLSFGDSTGCTQKHPVVYTRVSAHLNWIRTHIEPQNNTAQSTQTSN